MLTALVGAATGRLDAPLPIIILSALATGSVAMVAEWRIWRVHIEDRTTAVGQHLKVGAVGSELPSVRAVSLLKMGVARATVDIPYIPRDAQPLIEAHLSRGNPVLIRGWSMAGKSRLAAEIIKRHYPTHGFLYPAHPTSLDQLLELGLQAQRVVVWLDDLERYLGAAEGVTSRTLDSLLARGAVIIGTIRNSEFDHYLPRVTPEAPSGLAGINRRDPIKRREWEVLDAFKLVELHRVPSDAELQRVGRVISDERMLDGIRRYGLGEYVGAGMVLSRQMVSAEELHPVGHALILATADWRRAGMNIPVPRKTLIALLSHYLQSDSEIGSTQVEEGLAWATSLITPQVRLLSPVTHAQQECFTVTDYVLDLVGEHGRPIPEATWDAALRATGGDIPASFGVGFAARAHDRLDVSAKAVAQASRSAEERPSSIRAPGVLQPADDTSRKKQLAWRLAYAGALVSLLLALLANLEDPPSNPSPPEQEYSIKIGDTISPDEPRNGAGNLEVQGSVDVYSFEARAPQSLYVSRGPCFGPEWLHFDLDGPRGPVFQPRSRDCTEEDLGWVELPTAGVYQLRVSSTDSGTYTLKVAGAREPQVHSLSLEDYLSVNDARPGVGHIDAFDVADIYQFDARGGQVIYVQPVDNPCPESSVNTRWSVRGPKGLQILLDDWWWWCGDEPRPIELPVTGTYTLEVTAQGAAFYGFRLYPAPEPQRFAIRSGDAVKPDSPFLGAGRLEEPGSTDVYIFNALRGDLEILIEEPCTAGTYGLAWSLFAADLQPILDDVPGDCDLTIEPLQLPSTGIYELHVTGSAAADYSFRLGSG